MAVFWTAVAASAQTTAIWTGLAGPISGNTYAFEDPLNWQSNVAPVNGNNLVFGALPSINVSLTNNFTAGDITFSGIQNGLYLVGTGTLTLNGNVTTTTGSIYWGLFGLPVDLAAGNHLYSPGGHADLYHFNPISGVGGIVQNGPNNLILTQSSTYSGGTTINGGILFVGMDSALGTGTVTLNGGTLATSYTNFSEVTLPNNFVLPANPTFGSYVPDNTSLHLGVAGVTTVTPASGVPTVNLNLVGNQPLYLAGNMINGSGVTRYTFTNEAASFGFYLSGTNTYTGGTEVAAGSSVFFNQAASIPTTGFIYAPANAYAGLEDTSMTPANYISHFDLANSAGIVGFDNGYTSAGAVDLSGFSNSSLAIGTRTSATLSGPLTPVPGSGQYNFSGSGWLLLADPSTPNPLTGTNALRVTAMPESSPMVVVLSSSGTNNYTGNTIADGSAIIFDSDSSLSGGTSIQLFNGGYVGVTNGSGLSLTDLIGSFVSVSNGGVLGLDSSTAVANAGVGPVYTYSGAVDFKSLSTDLYLGTTGQTIVNGTIETANNNTGDYFLTGYKGGILTIDTPLIGSKAVHIGVPGIFQNVSNAGYSQVVLTNAANSFTGGLVLNSGYLKVTSPAALGSGSVTVDANASDGSVAFEGPYLSTITNNFILNSGLLYLNGNIDLTGVVSGSGQLQINNALSLSANNTYTGGTLLNGSQVSLYANNALGTGQLELIEGALAQFFTTTPQIGSLVRGDPYTSDGTYYSSLVLTAAGSTALTINQTVDGYFGGAIVQSGSVGSLIKTGPASLQIGGDLNSGFIPYSGGTTILQGKLIAGSSTALGTGPITINGGLLDASSGVVLANLIAFGANGGTLGGSGTFNTPITAGTNVILSPGNSPGTLTFGSGLTLAPGGTMNFEVQAANGAPGSGYDLIKVSAGLLNITATSVSPFTLKLISLTALGSPGNVSDFNSALGYTWMLITGNSAGGLTGFSANNFLIDASSFSNNLNGGVFSLTSGLDGSNPAIFLNFSPVPEPSASVLLALGLAALALKVRRRRA